VTSTRRGVLDTSTVVLLERLDAGTLPDEPLITVVTLAELSVGPLITDDPGERAARQLRLQQVEASFDPLPFDAAAARTFGAVAASLRRAGRKTTARAFDAVIASIALANGLDVYTCNARDFTGVDGLVVHPIEHPGPAR
jgi:predicted nucleic acid-binding protein